MTILLVLNTSAHKPIDNQAVQAIIIVSHQDNGRINRLKSTIKK
jgi:hypothetical protein